MEASEPVYVSRRRRSSLAMGLASVMMALFVACFLVALAYGISDPADLISLEGLEIYGIFGILIAVMLVGGRHLILDFTKSRAMRFYDDHIEVLLPRREVRSIPYSQLELGPPKNHVKFGVFYFSFQLSVKGEGKRASWDVDDARIAESEEDLYLWLRKRTQASPP